MKQFVLVSSFSLYAVTSSYAFLPQFARDAVSSGAQKLFSGGNKVATNAPTPSPTSMKPSIVSSAAPKVQGSASASAASTAPVGVSSSAAATNATAPSMTTAPVAATAAPSVAPATPTAPTPEPPSIRVPSLDRMPAADPNVGFPRAASNPMLDEPVKATVVPPPPFPSPTAAASGQPITMANYRPTLLTE